DQVLSGRRSPMAEKPRLDVFGTERLTKRRVLLQEDLADREIVRRHPVAVNLLERLSRQPPGDVGFFGIGVGAAFDCPRDGGVESESGHGSSWPGQQAVGVGVTVAPA